ncbi:MAG TPA: hypothetical protein VG320_22430 [Paraburkholderia sp.]|uniref:hypothetical protein n=1 Tax=Paraburkholderia sp. TaxID=1926495 RepID=UPI002DE20CD3|nr:hypothetical protein [Paraburkholderia sp.]
MNNEAPAPAAHTAPATAPATAASLEMAAQAAVASTQAANAAAAAQACPQCTTARVPGKRFCRQCGFDFVALDSAAPSIAAVPERQAALEPFEAKHEEIPAIAPQASEAELATIDVAPAALAESDTAQTHTPTAAQPHATFDSAPAQALAPLAPAAPIASDAQAGECCPECTTERTPGKRFCRSCGFDFTAPQQAAGIPGEVERSTHVEATQAAEITQTPVVASATEATRADEAVIAVTEAASIADSTTAGAVAQAMPESRYESQSESLSKSQREPDPAPRAEVPQKANAEAGQAAGRDVPSPAMTSAPSSARNEGGKKMWIIGTAAVVVVGVAVGAGLMLRSHHAPTASGDTAASPPLAASAPPFIEAASEAPAAVSAAVPAETPASAPAPSLSAALNAPAPDTPTTTASETNAASSGATVIDTRPQAQAQPQAEPPSPAPQVQTQPPEPAAPAARVHEKPKKSAAPADANGGENATIRAAIAGSLSDGNSCFSNKKFDCAISNAEAVLRLDPRNAQALSLRKRAKVAQQSALNSMSIE